MSEESQDQQDVERGDAIDDPSVAAAAEEYQISDLPEADAERAADEQPDDPEAPLVDLSALEDDDESPEGDPA